VIFLYRDALDNKEMNHKTSGIYLQNTNNFCLEKTQTEFLEGKSMETKSNRSRFSILHEETLVHCGDSYSGKRGSSG
jgi:hypothetical protein